MDQVEKGGAVATAYNADGSLTLDLIGKLAGLLALGASKTHEAAFSEASLAGCGNFPSRLALMSMAITSANCIWKFAIFTSRISDHV